MRTLFSGLLLATFLLAGCPDQRAGGAPSGTQPPPADTEPPPSAALSVLDANGATGPFVLGSLDRLLIDLDCDHLQPGAHAVRIAVMSPTGSLYAQLPATLQVDGSRKGRVSSTLQVRGTTIEGYRQLGTWQLVASVDGLQLASAAVDITP